MQNGLKVSFVNRDEFLALKGVKQDSLTKKPTEIQDANLVGDYTLKEAIHKTSKDPTTLDPTYTTQAQACTAGFLMISGADLHSHMMLHANGAKAKYEDASEIDPVIEAQEEFPKRLDEFFGQLDSMIRSGELDDQTINIDTVLAGSTERFEGEHLKINHVVKTSKDVRNVMIDLLNSRVKDIQDLGKSHGVTINSSQSHLLNQKVVVRSDLDKNAGEISATHMHYDPKNNTLSINAEYGIKSSESLFNEKILNNVTTGKEIADHYHSIEICDQHLSTEVKEALKHQGDRVFLAKLDTVNRKWHELVKDFETSYFEADVVKVPYSISFDGNKMHELSKKISSEDVQRFYQEKREITKELMKALKNQGLIQTTLGIGGTSAVAEVVNDTSRKTYAIKLLLNPKDTEILRCEREDLYSISQLDKLPGFVQQLAFDQEGNDLSTEAALVTTVLEGKAVSNLTTQYVELGISNIQVPELIMFFRDAYEAKIMLYDVGGLNNSLYDPETQELKILDFGSMRHKVLSSHPDRLAEDPLAASIYHMMIKILMFEGEKNYIDPHIRDKLIEPEILKQSPESDKAIDQFWDNRFKQLVEGLKKLGYTNQEIAGSVQKLTDWQLETAQPLSKQLEQAESENKPREEMNSIIEQKFLQAFSTRGMKYLGMLEKEFSVQA